MAIYRQRIRLPAQHRARATAALDHPEILRLWYETEFTIALHQNLFIVFSLAWRFIGYDFRIITAANR